MNPPLLTYTSDNLKRVVDSVVKNLTPDLLPKKYLDKNSKNWAFGHCHTSSSCIYKIFGAQNVNLYRALDPFVTHENFYHWWLIDKNGFIIDVTWTQYSPSRAMHIHKLGVKSGMLGFGYKRKVMDLLGRVRKDLDF